MRALWLNENGMMNFIEVPEPSIEGDDDVKIKVMYNTIGIQDLRMKRSWDFYAKGGIAGYEMAGVITDLGGHARANGFHVGQKVTGTVVKFCGHCLYCEKGQENNCLQLDVNSGTLCDVVVWNANQIISLPPAATFDIGCLLEPVAVVYMAVQKLHIIADDSVCIFGGDFNGLVLLQLIKTLGARTVTVVDAKKHNRDLAQQFGADYVIDAFNENLETELFRISDFIGFQKVAITSSQPNFISTAFNVAARGGTVLTTVYFNQNQNISINSVKFFAMNITLTSSFLYTKQLLCETRNLLPKLKLKELISHEYSFKNYSAAFSAEQQYRYPRIGIRMDD
ncbi:zinc-binding dehydrogenase [Sporolactobacillus sp. STCC-11]|uniref:zinc-dependent alcohol dehydrogenase n=1 Tax=Sporolactobacillus caesalpiniae TaxID=3230362 RepID=UPI0033919D24